MSAELLDAAVRGDLEAIQRLHKQGIRLDTRVRPAPMLCPYLLAGKVRRNRNPLRSNIEHRIELA